MRLSHADTEGPRRGTRCWVAVEGISERSERGRASDERPRTRVAKSRHGVTNKGPAAALWTERNRLPGELLTRARQMREKDMENRTR